MSHAGNRHRGNEHGSFGLRFFLVLTVVLAVHSVFIWLFGQQPPRYAASKPLPPVFQLSFVDGRVASYKTTPSAAEDPLEHPSPSHINNPVPGIGKLKPPQIATEIEQFANKNYLAIDEVDTAAEPVGDWVIDFSKWPLRHTSAVIVKLWISATGQLEHWELDGDLPDREAIEMALTPIDRTPINSARLNGHAVASFRRIEIAVEITR